MTSVSRSPAQSNGSVLTNPIMLGAWVLLIASAVWSTKDQWADIIMIAGRDDEQSHIILVPFVAAWMVWIRRARFRRFRPYGAMFGPLLILAGWIMSYVGYHNAIQSAWHAGAVVVLVGTIVTGLGLNTLLQMFPAFVVLVFLVPVPGTVRQMIAGPLQTASAKATQMILETFGAPIERSTNLLTINGHEIAVVEACNGMRMVLGLILVSFCFAFSMPLRPYVRLLVLIGSPLAAILCNIIRLVPTVLLYGYGPQAVADAFHDVSGWLMLPLAFLLLMGVTRALNWALVPVTRFSLAYQ